MIREKRFAPRVRSLGPVLWLALLFVSLLPGCNPGGSPGGGVYGPAYIPPCTCCCGGEGYVYNKKTSPAPISAAILHDTSGPMANVSANHGSIRTRSKKSGHK
ncbi:MAG: hypothetical protein ACYC9S_01825 [Leptospirales bacterium]